MTKRDYSFLIGLGKTIKNSAILFVPGLLAVLATVPVEWAWLTGPIVYLLNNYWKNK